MDTRKITLIATIAVIALVAVGIGYAYTASTMNQGNNADAEYIILQQEGTGAYNFANNNTKVYYDTINTAVDTNSYRISSATTDITIGAKVYSMVQVGNSFDIVVDASKASTFANMTCAMDASGFNVTDGWFFIVKAHTAKEATADQYLVYDGTSWAPAATSFLIYGGNSSYYNTTITVYYGMLKSNDGTPATLPTTAPNDKPLSNASITFTAAHDGNHVGDNYAINVIKIGGNGNCNVTVNNLYVPANGTAVLTITDDSGNYNYTVKLTDVSGNDLTSTKYVVNTKTITMPSPAKELFVTVTFKPYVTITGSLTNAHLNDDPQDEGEPVNLPAKVLIDTTATINGNALTIGNTTYYAFAANGYTFANWSASPALVGGKISANTTFTAAVTANPTLTFVHENVAIKTTNSSEGADAVLPTNVPINTAVTIDGNALTIGNTTYYAFGINDKTFNAWTVSPALVDGKITADTTFTATINS